MYEILLYRPDSYTQTGQASGKLKNMPDHNGNRTFDLKDIKTMITLRLHGFRNITYPNQLSCVALLACTGLAFQRCISAVVRHIF